MTGKLLTTFKKRITNFQLVPAGGGCFEVALDGELVYSKLETDEFPEEAAIEAMVKSRLKAK